MISTNAWSAALSESCSNKVMPLCDNVLVKAAARLGINRNTLHKKLSELQDQTPGDGNGGVVSEAIAMRPARSKP